MVEVADIPTIINSILVIVAAVSPIVAGYVVHARNRLTAFRKFIVALDDAWADGKITDAEYDKISELGHELVK